MTDLVVIGLDGAGFQLLQPWLDDDCLPTLSSFRSEGCWSPMRTCLPPVTCPAWRCYSTGVNPGKHGVFWWEQVDREVHDLTVPDSRAFDALDLWDYLGDAGHESAVINMPTTYPPRKIDGWLVGGIGCSDDYTYPSSLQAELEDIAGYRGRLEAPTSTVRDDPEFLSKILDLIDERFAAAEYLRETYDPDFLQVTLFNTNTVQHFYWGGEVTKRLWEHVDRKISELVDSSDNVVLMSDHGSNEIGTVFNLNTWLEQEGYLVTKRSGSDWLYQIGLTRETVADVLGRIRLRSVMERLAPDRLKYAFPDSGGGVGRAGKATKIDWERSTAVASGQGPIYVLAKGQRRTKVIEELREALGNLTSPDGTPVARAVLRASEVYEGPYVDDGPDLVVDQADHVHIPGEIGAGDVFVDPSDWKWESENHRDGLFMARGPDVAAAGQLTPQVDIFDLAPTILHWFGAPIPDHLDGTVRTDIFATGSDPASREPTVQPMGARVGEKVTERSDDEALREHLADLGYLSEDG